ncbi:MAG: hypothetical protein L0Y72_15380 [Gemmataceae bacterium]|nr:hypothetical protein [Gemmataceae bacterium]MCI0740427.1 hypothetical protein [Gemmataceae bacterium]
MDKIELPGTIDAVQGLTVELPPDVKPGPVKVTLEWIDEDEQAWAKWVSDSWSREWNDPREDIYGLEDGKPINEPR